MPRLIIAVVELVVFSILVLATRCANYQDVFVGGDIYFTDADCYSRMTRARMCLEHPGLILRQHSFENFPAGTTPHTTAPFDYLIVGVAELLKPFTLRALDSAGAIISPLLGLLAGWFLWWWSRRSKLRHRWALLLIYAASPIVVHGMELGRPDHQSLLILLMLLAVCSEWTLQTEPSRNWGAVNGTAWGLALWVSLYEPLVLLVIVLLCHAVFARQNFTARHRKLGWILLGIIVVLGWVIEQRWPAWPHFGSDPILTNWAATIGELKPVRLDDPIWLRWTGLLLVATPALLWIAIRKTFSLPVFMAVLLAATFALTVWQARWAYFFVAMFAVSLPALLDVIKSRIIAGTAIAISLWPIMSDWDATLWPNESESARVLERRFEAVQWRAAATALAGPTEAPFLAPWWWSPSVAYWSGQPGVGGSSHESIDGIVRTARFFFAPDAETAREILRASKANWVLVYDSDRTLANSSALLGVTPAANPIGRVLDRSPSQAPAFLRLKFQNGAAKVFRVQLSAEKDDFPSGSR